MNPQDIPLTLLNFNAAPHADLEMNRNFHNVMSLWIQIFFEFP